MKNSERVIQPVVATIVALGLHVTISSVQVAIWLKYTLQNKLRVAYVLRALV